MYKIIEYYDKSQNLNTVYNNEELEKVILVNWDNGITSIYDDLKNPLGFLTKKIEEDIYELSTIDPSFIGPILGECMEYEAVTLEKNIINYLFENEYEKAKDILRWYYF